MVDRPDLRGGRAQGWAGATRLGLAAGALAGLPSTRGEDLDTESLAWPSPAEPPSPPDPQRTVWNGVPPRDFPQKPGGQPPSLRRRADPRSPGASSRLACQNCSVPVQSWMGCWVWVLVVLVGRLALKVTGVRARRQQGRLWGSECGRARQSPPLGWGRSPAHPVSAQTHESEVGYVTGEEERHLSPLLASPFTAQTPPLSHLSAPTEVRGSLFIAV